VSASELGNTHRLLNAVSFFAPDTTHDKFRGTFTGVQIYALHVSRTALTSTFNQNYESETPVLIYSKSSLDLNIPENTWGKINFDSSFAYNGSDNLLIEIRWNGSPSGDLITSTTTGNALHGERVTSTTGTFLSRPVLRMHYALPPLVNLISGYVHDASGTGLSGVTLQGLHGDPVTDTNGFYSAMVWDGWSGTVTPHANNYFYDPYSIAYSNISDNIPQQHYTAFSTVGLEAKNTSVTYTIEDIPTDGNFTELPGASASPGSLTVSLPPDAIITGTDVSYKMTAANTPDPAWISEQRSWLHCASPGGFGESRIAMGIGNRSGTYSYARTGLNIANGVRGQGNVIFELHAGRTYGYGGVSTKHNKVDNNSWFVTVHYVEMSLSPPINVSTEALEITEGQTGQFGVSLGKAPTSNVTINVERVAGSTNIVVQSGASLTFTPSNWDTEQMVAIYASQDANWTNDVATFRCVDPSGRYTDSPLITVTELDEVGGTITFTVLTERGTPVPSGTTTYTAGTPVTFSMTDSPVEILSNTQYEATGWAVPVGSLAPGEGTNHTFDGIQNRCRDVGQVSGFGSLVHGGQTGEFNPTVRDAHACADLPGEAHLMLPHSLPMPRAGPPRFVAQCCEVAHGFLGVERMAEQVRVGVIAHLAVGPQDERGHRAVAAEHRACPVTVRAHEGASFR
jgi:hypothetical protein